MSTERLASVKELVARHTLVGVLTIFVVDHLTNLVVLEEELLPDLPDLRGFYDMLLSVFKWALSGTLASRSELGTATTLA